jgi:hypothetical protein
MRKLWDAFLAWCDEFARVKAARELSNRGMINEARQIMMADFSKERK